MKKHLKNKENLGNSNLKTQLALLGLAVKDILGDGNCCFRSLSDQVFGRENEHFLIRKAVVEELRFGNLGPTLNPDTFTTTNLGPTKRTILCL